MQFDFGKLVFFIWQTILYIFLMEAIKISRKLYLRTASHKTKEIHCNAYMQKCLHKKGYLKNH